MQLDSTGVQLLRSSSYGVDIQPHQSCIDHVKTGTSGSALGHRRCSDRVSTKLKDEYYIFFVVDCEHCVEWEPCPNNSTHPKPKGTKRYVYETMESVLMWGGDGSGSAWGTIFFIYRTPVEVLFR